MWQLRSLTFSLIQNQIWSVSNTEVFLVTSDFLCVCVCVKEQYFDTGAQISEMPGSDLLCGQLGISYFVPSTLSEWFLWRTAFRRRNYDAFSPGLRKLHWTSNKLKVWIIRQCCPLMDKACNIHNCPGGLGSVAASRFWLKQCKVITDWSLYWRTEWGGLLMLDFKLSVL